MFTITRWTTTVLTGAVIYLQLLPVLGPPRGVDNLNLEAGHGAITLRPLGRMDATVQASRVAQTARLRP